MADKDVITALELCANISQDGCMMLCPYKDDQDETYHGLCEHIMKQDAIELIKRQQAEIEYMKSERTDAIEEIEREISVRECDPAYKTFSRGIVNGLEMALRIINEKGR